jgi:hypothetical protein
MATVTVQPGDSAFRIAERELGNQKFFEAIFAANPSVDFANLQPGQVLTLPNVDTTKAGADITVSQAGITQAVLTDIQAGVGSAAGGQLSAAGLQVLGDAAQQGLINLDFLQAAGAEIPGQTPTEPAPAGVPGAIPGAGPTPATQASFPQAAQVSATGTPTIGTDFLPGGIGPPLASTQAGISPEVANFAGVQPAGVGADVGPGGRQLPSQTLPGVVGGAAFPQAAPFQEQAAQGVVGGLAPKPLSGAPVDIGAGAATIAGTLGPQGATQGLGGQNLGAQTGGSLAGGFATSQSVASANSLSPMEEFMLGSGLVPALQQQLAAGTLVPEPLVLYTGEILGFDTTPSTSGGTFNPVPSIPRPINTFTQGQGTLINWRSGGFS